MKLVTWGANSYGQLGLGFKSELVSEPTCLSPSRLSCLPNLKDIYSLNGGGGHSLILTNSGEVYGCGWNKAGQLLARDTFVLDFTLVPGLEKHKIIHLATLWDTCFAVTNTGLCLGWGSNTYGQFGVSRDKVTQEFQPLILSQDGKQIECGVRHSVLLYNNGSVATAGDNKFGRLGRGSMVSRPDFGLVPNLRNIKSIACGFNHSIALSENGKIYVWGCNKWGQLGMDPKATPWLEFPEELAGLQGNHVSIHAGWSSTHILTKSGSVLNFGRNNYGQLGQKDCPDVKPWEVHVLHDIKKLSVGSEHAVALTNEDKLVSWGWNEHGSCGNGSVDNQFSPVGVEMDISIKVKNFVAASGHNFALGEEKSV